MKTAYPQTRKSDQTDNYFGTEVPDPYRWLEDANSTETTKWVESQNKAASDYLSNMPYRDEIRSRLDEVCNYPRYSIVVGFV